MKKAIIGVLAFFVFTGVCLAGSSSTNPETHQKSITNKDGTALVFKPKLTLEWIETQMSGSNAKGKYINKIKYEIYNDSMSDTITIASVKLLDKTAKGVTWSGTPSQEIKKKTKKSWSSGDLGNNGRSMAISIIELEIDYGGKYWYLVWDPNVSGSNSTSISTTMTAAQ